MNLIKYLSQINPLLAAAFPVVSLCARNINEVSFPTALAALSVTLFGSSLLMLTVWLLVRNAVKAGLIAAIWLLLFFSYGPVLALVDGFVIADFDIGRQRYLLVLELLVAGWVFWAVLKARVAPGNFTPYLTVALTILLAMNLATIIPNKLNNSHFELANLDDFGGVTVPEIDSQGLPDIYYIILDSYPREDVLKGVYGFDNREFLEHLTRLGFYVASTSQTNYMQTSLAMSAALNMEYVEELLEEMDPDSGDQMILLPVIEKNRVVQFAKSMGYRFVFVRSLSPLFRSNPNADIKLTPRVYPFQSITKVFVNPVMESQFGSTLLRSTALRGFVDRWFGVTWVRVHRESMAQLEIIPDLEGPVFNFTHIYPPHPPYVFDRDGNERNIPYQFPDAWADRESYIEQLVWVNRSMERAIEVILEKSGDQVIIVIQSDHGSSSSKAGRVLYYGGEPDETLITERVGILNAYHLPDSCGSQQLYDSITPVNSFRVIFDNCFGTDFGLLEDKTFWSSYDRPFDLVPLDELPHYAGE